MTNNPDQIRREIEDTRGRLSNDVNALTETVSPSNVARRQADKVAGVATSVKERVMGAADDVRGSGSDAASSVGRAPGAAADKARRKTEGNPLAAGLIALGAGWLVGSMLPASEKEKQAAVALKDKAEPLIEEAKSVAQDTAQELKEPAQQAAASVKTAATDAAGTVTEEGKATADDVKAQAQSSADTVRSTQE
ncbi:MULTISPECIES: DUF3618 domain-containing protein [unclassified Phycicoccus]|uniref:DUF3618 domain-containing protein n=1 Tax=unclassified Phycicoccus TaxID=2637926 RepID=UPI000703B789|nr:MULTISPECIES: DUF3618 domain-containing protein [unclassified Phycicoccus]KQU66296.1 hypothetical protein ASC58_14600 [Phycicoccus sp. Root101]KQZ87443.1 hypothetical protein ASD62_17825 [Phycicoccus sp. Root563]